MVLRLLHRPEKLLIPQRLPLPKHCGRNEDPIQKHAKAAEAEIEAEEPFARMKED